MTTQDCTCRWQIQEPTEPYSFTHELLATKQVTVQSTTYPPLKANSRSGAWRRIPWINLRGFWLADVGFGIGAPYTIEVYEKKLIFTVD